MLSRSPTKITLTQADLAAFEQRRAARDAMKAQEMDSSQDTTESLSLAENTDSPAVGVQSAAARARKAREARIGFGGGSRG